MLNPQCDQYFNVYHYPSDLKQTLCISKMGDRKKSGNNHEDNQIDIMAIDSKINEFFKQEKKNLSNYKQQLEDLERAMKSKNLSHHSIKHLKESIQKLRNKIYNIEQDIDSQYYTSESIPIIMEYEEILRTPIKVSFMGKKPKGNKKKKDLIDRYVRIACKYMEISVPCDTKAFKMTCPNCKNRKDFEMEDNIYSCLNCGCEQEDITQTSSYKDSGRVNIAAKYTYDRTIHFRDAMNQHQAKQNCTIDQRIFDHLEEEFESHRLLVGDSTTPRKKRFSRITKKHIYEFLKELGRSKHTTSEKQFYTKHYENVNLIHYKFTLQPPDDIGYLEDDLMNDFSQLIELYDKIYKEDDDGKTERKNFLNTQHILYQLLKNRKHKCRKDDFNMLKTDDRKNFHDEICDNLFSKLGWNYEPFI